MYIPVTAALQVTPQPSRVPFQTGTSFHREFVVTFLILAVVCH